MNFYAYCIILLIVYDECIVCVENAMCKIQIWQNIDFNM